MPEVQDLGGLMMLDGIRAACAEQGFAVIVGGWDPRSAQSAETAEAEFLRMAMARAATAGAIVWEVGSPEFAEIYDDMRASGFPIVCIDRRPAIDQGIDVVSVDHQRGAALAVRTLIELGHERIAIAITDEQAASVRARIEGYRQALGEADLAVHDGFMFRVDADASSSIHDCAAKEMRRLFAESEPPTAIFAVQDMLALHLLEAAKAIGLEVPERLSVIGFDWLMRWQPSGGHLSTVAQPFEEIGRAAAQRLLEIARSAVPSTARHILLEASVVVKDTTAAPFHYAPTTSGATINGGFHG
jgi:DNA-binding LacI/PurR family transcriptional regulator